MGDFNVSTREGLTRTIAGRPGHTLMELIRDDGVDELIAFCGGCCSCATCHIYVSSGNLGALPEITEDEDDLLESADHRTAQSRLSCQIMWSENLSGLAVTIAPEE